MHPLLIAGLVGAVVEITCYLNEDEEDSKNLNPEQGTPPSSNTQEKKPAYQYQWQAGSIYAKAYLALRILGVSDQKLDTSISNLNIPEARADKIITPLELEGFLLTNTQQFPRLSLAFWGDQPPRTLEDLILKHPFDKEQRQKLSDLLSTLDKELKKNGHKKEEEKYKELISLSLLYLFSSRHKSVDLVNKLGEANLRGLLRSSELATNISSTTDTLSEEGLLSKIKTNSSLGLSAAEALENKTAGPAEYSKILYGALQQAGLHPHFVKINPKMGRLKALRKIYGLHPNYTHTAVALKNPDGSLQIYDGAFGASYSVASTDKNSFSILSLSQFRALDLSLKAQFLLEEGKIKEAKIAVDKALSHDLTSLELKMTQAQIELQQGKNIEQTLSTLSQLARKKNNYAFYLIAARAYEDQGEIAPAIEQINLAISQEPHQYLAHLRKGLLLLQQENPDPKAAWEAFTEGSKALSRTPALELREKQYLLDKTLRYALIDYFKDEYSSQVDRKTLEKLDTHLEASFAELVFYLLAWQAKINNNKASDSIIEKLHSLNKKPLNPESLTLLSRALKELLSESFKKVLKSDPKMKDAWKKSKLL